MKPASANPAHARRIRYVAAPTLAKLHASRARVRGVLGPIGSGKSVACVMELWRMALCQAPNSAGIRKSRVAVIRNTYGELRTTTIKTWREWIPAELCPIVYDSPIRGLLKMPHPDGRTSVECEVLFMALDQERDLKKLLSLELTAAWINEAREVPYSVVISVRSRCGRYPRKEEAPLTQTGVLCDTNPPDTDHWWYSLAELRRTPQTALGEDGADVSDADFEFWSQPPAILRVNGQWLANPDAENVVNHSLGYRYWLDQTQGTSPEWIKVYLQGRYGYVREGKVVYPEYRDDVHCGKDLQPIPGLPLIGGWDFGLTPAFVLGQLSPRGTLSILDEWTTDSMGIEQFASQVVIPQLQTRYAAWDWRKQLATCGDPAGAQKAQTDERTCFDSLVGLGFSVIPARTNAFLARRESVATRLNRMDVGIPAFRLSTRCNTLRKGFLGGYHYRRMQVPGKTLYRDEPDKDAFSHPHDALQYLALFTQFGDLRSQMAAPYDNAGRSRLPNPRRRVRGLVL